MVDFDIAVLEAVDKPVIRFSDFYVNPSSRSIAVARGGPGKFNRYGVMLFAAVRESVERFVNG